MAAGGCSEVDVYGIPLYCRLCCYEVRLDKITIQKVMMDEDEMPVFC